MQRWLHGMGYALEWMRDEIQGAARFAADAAEPADLRETFAELVEELREAPERPSARGLADAALPLAASAAGGWLASRLLRPREVHLPRAVVAGLVGTLLYDLVAQLDRRVSGREFDTIRPLGEALTDREELQGIAGWTAHYAAGVGLAVVYGRFVYGRIPAPALVQGSLFGAIDAFALQWGGVLPLLSRVVPDAGLPSGLASLGSDPELTARSLARHLAYGAALGAIYRDGK